MDMRRSSHPHRTACDALSVRLNLGLAGLTLLSSFLENFNLLLEIETRSQ